MFAPDYSTINIGRPWGTGGGSGGFGGQSAGNQIRNDPFYIQQQALVNAQGEADAARLSQQLSDMLIQFGAVPEGVTFSHLDPLTGQLASENTNAGLSLLARIQKAADDSRRGTLNQLAGSGMLQSGETGYQLGELALGRKQSEYDARQSVLSRIHDLQSAFANAQLQRQLAMIDAAMSAYSRVRSTHPFFQQSISL
jgi:hypothetical protein